MFREMISAKIYTSQLSHIGDVKDGSISVLAYWAAHSRNYKKHTQKQLFAKIRPVKYKRYTILYTRYQVYILLNVMVILSETHSTNFFLNLG